MHRALIGGARLAVAEPADVIRVLGGLDHGPEQDLQDLVQALPLRRRQDVQDVAEHGATPLHCHECPVAAEIGQSQGDRPFVGPLVADDQVRCLQLVDQANSGRMRQAERTAQRAVRAPLVVGDHVQRRHGRGRLVRVQAALLLQPAHDLRRERAQQVRRPEHRHSISFRFTRWIDSSTVTWNLYACNTHLRSLHAQRYAYESLATSPYRAVGVESKVNWADTPASLATDRTEETRSPAALARSTSPEDPDRDARRDQSGVENRAAPPRWRLADEQDFDRIVEMNERLNAEDPSESMPFDRTMMQRTLGEILVNPLRGAVAVLESAGRRCGYGLLISFWSNEFGGEICAVDELYVEPEFRGRGLATQLIQIVANGGSSIWPRRIAMITVEAYRTNPRAKALYERLGFETSPNHSLTLVLAGRAAGV
jgi:ribosomal protein S18 acetylase RimI-like enzyme